MKGAEGAKARGGAAPFAGERPGDARPRFGRRLLVPAAVFLSLAAVVALIGWAVFDRQAEDMRAESAGALQAVWQGQSAQVSRWFSDEKHDTALLGAAAGIVGPLERHIDAGAGGPVPRDLLGALDLYRRGHGVASISVLDPSLRTVLVSPARAAPPGRRGRDLAAQALRSGAVEFSDLYLAPSGVVVMDFAVPVRGAPSSPSAYPGALVLRLHAEEVLYPLLQDWPASLTTGESVLAAVRGKSVVSLNPLAVGGLSALEVIRPLTATDRPAVMAARGRSGVVEGVDYRDEPVLAAIGKVPATSWYLVAKQDLAVIDQPIQERGLATLAWVVGLIVLAGVALLLYWRSLEARNLRELVGMERERRRAEARYAALMREAKEIVLLLDDEAVIVEANDYALATYGYSRDQLVGRGVDIVRGTPGDYSLGDRKAAIEEAGGHLTLEGVHRRSDGVEFPVEIGVSSLVVEGEEYFLEIVRDVGERKAAEAALRDGEARYRTLFENALSGFALHELVVDDAGRPVDYVFLAANPAFESQTGLATAQVVGRRASEVVPGLQETGLIERYGKVAMTGEPERFEMYLPGLDRHFDIQVVSPRPGQFATIFLDITQRREAEEILSGFFRSSPVGLFIVDTDLRYVRVNDTLAGLNRVPPGGHLGRRITDVSPGVAGSMAGGLERVVATGEALHGLEVEESRPGQDGQEHCALVSLFPIKDPQDALRFIGGVVVDITQAKRAERELEQNKAFLERVLAVSPDLTYIFDIVGQRTVFSNREMVDVLGYTPEEMQAMGGEVLPRLLHPDDRALMADHHARARELVDGDVLAVEYRMRHLDGEWRVLHARDTVFARDELGRVTQLIGTAQDVTGQRAAAAEVARLSQRFEATVMASPLAMVALDAERRVQFWNPAATAVFGWSAQETVGEEVRFIPPDARARADELVNRLAGGEQFAGLELPCVRKDGERIHTSVSLAPMQAADGRPDSVLVIAEDVTERRANEVRLARLTRLYQVLSAVTEASSKEREPVRLYEKVCRIVVERGGFRLAWAGKRRRNGSVEVLASAGVQAAADEIALDTRAPADQLSTAGIALVEGRSDTCLDIAADPRMAPHRAHAAKWGLRSMAAVPIIIDGRHDTVLAIYSAEPGHFDTEEVGLLERLAGDVGFAIEAAGKERARRTAERRLEALNADLERRVRARTDELEVANAELESFSYSVSHDLRAPLRALDGFSLALLEDYGDLLDGEAADFLARIRGASQRMARLIDDLLMLSRVTQRGMTWERVDISALAVSIAADLEDEEPGRTVKLTVEPDMSVEGDAQLLDVALRNLLGNAWKFTSRTDEALIEVGVDAGGEDRVYFVRDNGAGFDAQYADKLFAPFQRLHSDGDFPGTGIGLATVQRIVRRHGGRVWAEGAPGKGATVWFTLRTGGNGP